MSLCFFVPADQAGGSAEEVEQEVSEEVSDSSQQTLQQFWSKVSDDIRKVTAEDFKTQALPLARIKKIMKLDEEVKMISAEAPVLFAKAAEIFIHELTLRAWSHTEDNKRRTLQRNDIAMAISKSDMFDFLIDIVPRHEVKPSVPRADSSHNHHRPQQTTNANVTEVGGSSNQCSATIQSPAAAQPQFVIQQMGQQQIVQPSSSGTGGSQVSGAGGGTTQPVTLLQQVVTPAGEVQQVPIQLTAAQLNMIRLQMQANPNQPIIIQAAPQHQHPTPQIIQVSSQAPHQGQQVYLQVANQED